MVGSKFKSPHAAQLVYAPQNILPKFIPHVPNYIPHVPQIYHPCTQGIFPQWTQFCNPMCPVGKFLWLKGNNPSPLVAWVFLPYSRQPNQFGPVVLEHTKVWNKVSTNSSCSTFPYLWPLKIPDVEGLLVLILTSLRLPRCVKSILS